MYAVRFDHHGGPDVLEVREVDEPVAAAGRVLVRVRAAAINPGEIAIREDFLEERFPSTFPSDRVRAVSPGGAVTAFIDTFGGGYVDLAVALGVPADRINTVSDFEAVERHGVHGRGSSQIASPEVLAELTALVAAGEVEIPIAAEYPLAQVREAYAELAQRHTRGKIVLVP